MIEKLTDNEREAALLTLAQTGWHIQGERDAIEKKFEFGNFTDAFGWMTRVAIWAEKWNHHPEWSNVYNRVHVVLTTHDVDGLSNFDLKLAKKMDSLSSSV